MLPPIWQALDIVNVASQLAMVIRKLNSKLLYYCLLLFLIYYFTHDPIYYFNANSKSYDYNGTMHMHVLYSYQESHKELH